MASMPECLTLGNGSNDVLVLLAEAFLTPATEAVYSQYCFAIYPIVVQASGATARVAPALSTDDPMPLGHDLDAMAEADHATHAAGLSRQSQQSDRHMGRIESVAGVPGRTCRPARWLSWMRRTSNIHVMPKCPDTTSWLEELPNLVVLRTFSKAYGLAGLRVGYAISQPQIAETLNRLRQPFNVNSIALAAATAALDDLEHVRGSVDLNRAALAELRVQIARLGLQVLPSAGNFVLVDLGRPVGPIFEGLLRRGVIARPVGNYGLPNHLRITTGTLEQTRRAIEALASVRRKLPCDTDSDRICSSPRTSALL